MVRVQMFSNIIIKHLDNNHSSLYNKARKFDFHSSMLKERETIKNMLNYIEQASNFRGVIWFIDVISDVTYCHI